MTTSDSQTPKIGGKCKQHAIIFYGGRVIVNFVRVMAHFVPNFVAMATGVDQG